MLLKHGEEGIVDNVFITENEEGHKLVEVKMRQPMIPEVGDKFTSKHGQKGIIGMIVPPEDLPFSNSGIIPDMITSAHGIPSRMTFSHLMELRTSSIDRCTATYV